MYRAVTLYAMRNGMYPDAGIQEEALKAAIDAGKILITFKFNAETGRPDTYLNGEKVEDEIRQMEVSNRVSPIAALPFVRALLTEQQQATGKEKGIVMDGRDIGTAVFPQAEMKVFVTASAKVRAERRYKELLEKAKTQEELAALNFDEVLKNVEERDYIDSHREVAPLRQAEDALVLDNSNMTREEQSAWLLEKYKEIVAE
jgi:cytidylate kinase